MEVNNIPRYLTPKYDINQKVYQINPNNHGGVKIELFVIFGIVAYKHKVNYYLENGDSSWEEFLFPIIKEAIEYANKNIR